MPAIAAGHPEVTRACHEVLKAGGNAVDAACAGALAACVCEPVLASLGGGGLAMVAAPGGEVLYFDFWARAGEHQRGPSGQEVLLDWSGGIQQPFMVGPDSAGMWRLPAGIDALISHFGSMDRPALASPALRLARSGVELNQSQAEWMRLLHGVHIHRPDSPLQSEAPKAGDVFAWPGLDQDLTLFAAEGHKAFEPGGEFWDKALAVLGQERAASLAGAQSPVEAQPVTPFLTGGWQVYLAGAPSISSHHIQQVLSGINAPDGYRSLAASLGRPGDSVNPSTTAISVMDDAGLRISVVISNGSGGGVFVGGTQLNNVAGEVDLRSSAGRMPEGQLPTRMCPAFAQGDRGWLIMGSGGSERITTATLHTLYGVIFESLDLAEAIETPRIYLADELQAEPEAPAARYLPEPINYWPGLDPYFGGVNAVGVLGGEPRACSDPRRQGLALIG